MNDPNIPEDLLYTESHEWVRIDGDVATVGITDHAQTELGDVVYLDMPKVGTKLESKEVFGTVESVKTVSDLYSPVSGEVIEVNTALNEHSEVVNTDPYGEGWIIRLKLGGGALPGHLLSAEQYRRHIEEGDR